MHFSWSWNFDNDGISDSEEKDPAYEYITPGNYIVNLTVSNTNGTASKTRDIVALEAKSLPVTEFVAHYYKRLCFSTSKETQVTASGSGT